MNISSTSFGEAWRDQAYALLRIVVGLMFLTHGYAKFTTGVDNVAGFFGGAGVPLPGLIAYLVTYGEMVIGIALILGLFTHYAVKLGILIILGAIFFVHIENGYSAQNGGYEYPLMILAALLVLLSGGAGRYSLDARNMQKSTATQAA